MTDKPNPAAMWDERFAQPEPVYGHEPNTYLREQAKKRLNAGAKILVPADGYGRNGLWLAKQGFDVTTVDVSAVGVERARKAAKENGINASILLSDLNTWQWPKEEFEAVASIYLHLPPDQRPGIHTHMFEALKPGGIIILEAFNHAQLKFSSGGPKQVELLYTQEILCRDFASAEVIELAETEADLAEGKMHSGRSAVVRAVFRKKDDGNFKILSC
jgi:2-polyprenyl-3-methyl-5-hydroxy-6-metoxy-1,4-benzoquinol methylase